MPTKRVIPTFTFSAQKSIQGKFTSFISSLLAIHAHRLYRGFFILILVFHILMLFSPWIDLQTNSSPQIRYLFSIAARVWPFPTFKMFKDENALYFRTLLMKSLEISVILLYAVDLVPKIFIWKKSLLWKSINIIIITLMVCQLPAHLIAFSDEDFPLSRIKERLFSISLCFILLCEILSIREQRRIKLTQLPENKIKIERQNNVKKIPEQLRNYSWIEIIKHDKQGDCWIVIEDKIYDVTQFVKKHPGGSMIYDGAGGDCTAMWHSYHSSALTKNPPPQKYLIGQVRDYKPYYSYDGSFYQKVKQEVERTIPKEKYQNDWRLYVKAIVIFPLYFYVLYYYITETTLISALLLGFVAGQAGVNIMHDGNHAAFTSNKSFSLFLGYALDMTFSTSVVYRRSHNFGHHGCVNHYELDRAFDTTYPLMRLHPMQPRLPMHKYQHIYVWLVYGLANFGDLFGTFDEMYWMSNFPTRRGHLTKTQLYMQIFVKLTWIICSMIIPSYLHGWFSIFPCWFIYMVAHAYSYVFFFAVNHWTTEAGVIDNTKISQVNWGILQVINSSNFALKSTFWTHLAGGLNYQIEHHLFPQLAHTRLPQIAPIVQRLSKEYNIRYFEFKSFWTALKSHYDLLQILGERDSLEP